MKQLIISLIIILSFNCYAYGFGGGGWEYTGSKDSSGTIINPATEDKQDDIIVDTGTIAGDTTSIDGKIPADPSTVTEQDQTQALMIDGSQKAKVVDDEGDLASVDGKSGSIQVIAFEHHKIHQGKSFERHVDSNNANVATINVAFKTVDSTEIVHMIMGWSSNDEILFEVLEGATWTQGTGTAITLYNHNRQSVNTSTTILEDKNQATFTASNQIIQDVTGISGGVQFEKQYTYNAGLGASTSPENRVGGHEWFLKPDTTYVIRMTQTGGNCKMSIDVHFYEHTPLN